MAFELKTSKTVNCLKAGLKRARLTCSGSKQQMQCPLVCNSNCIFRLDLLSDAHEHCGWYRSCFITNHRVLDAQCCKFSPQLTYVAFFILSRRVHADYC